MVCFVLLALWCNSASKTLYEEDTLYFSHEVCDLAENKGIPVLEYDELEKDNVSLAIFGSLLPVVEETNATVFVNALGSKAKILTKRFVPYNLVNGPCVKMLNGVQVEGVTANIVASNAILIVYYGLDRHQAAIYKHSEVYSAAQYERTIKNLTEGSVTFAYGPNDAIVTPAVALIIFLIVSLAIWRNW
ncbi:MAG: hypothetical protein WCX69_02845 [Candidatus Paceibacterota bacterium]